MNPTIALLIMQFCKDQGYGCLDSIIEKNPKTPAQVSFANELYQEERNCSGSPYGRSYDCIACSKAMFKAGKRDYGLKECKRFVVPGRKK